MPRVSIYILCYNQAAFLEQRITSVLNQTYTNYKIIIIDDASNDNSKDIISKFADHEKVHSIIYNEKNSGSGYKQWQKAIEDCETEYLWIAEGDDFAEPGFLQRCVDLLDADASLCLVETNSKYIYENEKGLHEYTAQLKNKNFPKPLWHQDFVMKGVDIFSQALCFGCCIPNVSAVLFRAKNVRELHFKISKYRFCGDWALYILLSQQYSFAYVHDVLSNFRLHQESAFMADDKTGQKQRELFTIINTNIALLKDLKRYPPNYIKMVQRYVSVFGVPAMAKIGLLSFYFKRNSKAAFAGLLYNISSRIKGAARHDD